MKARVQYNDFEGTVAADISDGIGGINGDDLEAIGKYFDLDEKRFKIVGLSIYGTSEFSISLICVDKQKSTNVKEHLVNMICKLEDEKEILNSLFKRLHIVLYDRFDDKYINADYDQEVLFSDFHNIEDK